MAGRVRLTLPQQKELLHELQKHKTDSMVWNYRELAIWAQSWCHRDCAQSPSSRWSHTDDAVRHLLNHPPENNETAEVRDTDLATLVLRMTGKDATTEEEDEQVPHYDEQSNCEF